jgi:hypothetical protein
MRGLLLGIGLIFAAAPSSTNFTLKSYDFGSGGTSSSTSTNYSLNGISGEQSASGQTSSSYSTVSGINATIDANEPPAPSVTNPSNYYDRLQIVLNTANNPSDTRYLIAISSNGFTTTQYVQSSNSIGTSQALINYQTYTAWGGASGFYVTGLAASTTYQVKVKALEGNFSGSPYGPIASAATVAQQVSFGLTTSPTSAPLTVSFPSLTPGSVISGNASAVVSLTSNADNGGTVYIKSANGGLTSVFASTTISSATANLTAATSGYGAQVNSSSTTQTAGGPFTIVSPFNGTGNSVGGLATTLQPILVTGGPITSGTSTIALLAKVSNITPSASDYSDSLTLVAAMNF